MHYAAGGSGDTSVVIQYLAEMGVDINGRAGSGWSPLHQAANTGHVNNVRTLMELDSNASIQSVVRW